MTKTAHQLWWDEEFIEKRIKEQRRVISTILLDPNLPFDRGAELYKSAKIILSRFERQLENINKLK